MMARWYYLGFLLYNEAHFPLLGIAWQETKRCNKHICRPSFKQNLQTFWSFCQVQAGDPAINKKLFGTIRHRFRSTQTPCSGTCSYFIIRQQKHSRSYFIYSYRHLYPSQVPPLLYMYALQLLISQHLWPRIARVFDSVQPFCARLSSIPSTFHLRLVYYSS